MKFVLIPDTPLSLYRESVLPTYIKPMQTVVILTANLFGCQRKICFVYKKSHLCMFLLPENGSSIC